MTLNRIDIAPGGAALGGMKLLAWLGVVLYLLGRYLDAMWTDSVDVAHHYALVTYLAEHWHMPMELDRTLGEMNFYPRGGHAIAAVLGTLLGSSLLGMQLTVLGSVIGLWAAIMLLVMNLPAGKRVVSALLLLLLLYVNGRWLHIEVHGGELYRSYFLSQILAHALVWASLAAVLYVERGQRSPWQRNGLMLLAMWLIAYIHLLPVMQLLGVYGVLVALDAWRDGNRKSLVQALAWLLAGLLVVLKHPSFAVMKSLSLNDGGIYFHFLNKVPVITAYASLVLLVSLWLVWHWYRLPENERKLWLVWKIIGASGIAMAGFCLLQALATQFGQGSPYAVKKYLFAIHTTFLLEIVLLAGWWFTRMMRSQPRPVPHCAAAVMLALAVVSVLPRDKVQNVADLVAYEREMLALRDQIPPQPGRHTYVLQMAGQGEWIDYMASIGIFKAPRTPDGYGMYVGSPWRWASMIGAIVTTKNSPIDQFPACRRKETRRGLVWIDYACIKAQNGMMETYFYLQDDVGTGPCQLQGFSYPERVGRWTMAKTANLHCKVPLMPGGKVAQTLSLLSTAIVPGTVQVLQNGAMVKQFVFDAGHMQQLLDVPLVPNGEREVDLQIHIPWARSPKSLGSGADERELGLAVESLEFK